MSLLDLDKKISGKPRRVYHSKEFFLSLCKNFEVTMREISSQDNAYIKAEVQKHVFKTDSLEEKFKSVAAMRRIKI